MSVRDRQPTRAEIRAMSSPMRCMRCGHVHDSGKVKVVDRYLDCSTWPCPSCGSLIDDRPVRWGGSAEKVEKPPTATASAIRYASMTDAECRGLAISYGARINLERAIVSTRSNASRSRSRPDLERLANLIRAHQLAYPQETP